MKVKAIAFSKHTPAISMLSDAWHSSTPLARHRTDYVNPPEEGRGMLKGLSRVINR